MPPSSPYAAAANFLLPYSMTAGFSQAYFFEFLSLFRTVWKSESTIFCLLMLIDTHSCLAAYVAHDRRSQACGFVTTLRPLVTRSPGSQPFEPPDIQY